MKTSATIGALALLSTAAYAGGATYSLNAYDGVTKQTSSFLTVPSSANAYSQVINTWFFSQPIFTNYQNESGAWVTVQTGSIINYTGYANAIITRTTGGLVYFTQVHPGSEYDADTHTNYASATLSPGTYQIQANVQNGGYSYTYVSW